MPPLPNTETSNFRTFSSHPSFRLKMTRLRAPAKALGTFILCSHQVRHCNALGCGAAPAGSLSTRQGLLPPVTKADLVSPPMGTTQPPFIWDSQFGIVDGSCTPSSLQPITLFPLKVCSIPDYSSLSSYPQRAQCLYLLPDSLPHSLVG